MAIPVITSPLIARGSVGTFFSYQIAGTNTPTSFDAYRRFDELPPGLAINRTSGVISGTPTTVVPIGTYVQIYATNADGTGKGYVRMDIAAAPGSPVITSSDTAAGIRNVPFTYTITATGATRYAVFGLPSGLTLNTVTGVISGTHTLVGAFLVTLLAANVANQQDILYATFRFTQAGNITPVITSPLVVISDKGQHVGYTATANNVVNKWSLTPAVNLTDMDTGFGEFGGIPNTQKTTTNTLVGTNLSIPGSPGTAVLTWVVQGAVPGPPSLIPSGLSALITPDLDTPSAILSNPKVDMVSIQVSWATMNTAPLVYNFTSMAARVNAALTANKKVLLRIITGGGALAQGGNVPNHVLVEMGISNPALHTVVPGVTYTYDAPGGLVTIPVPWHPIFLAYKRQLYRAYRSWFSTLPQATKDGIIVEAVSVASGTPGSEEWNMPHSVAVVGTGGPTGTGYVLSEKDRWLNATDAANPGAGYTTAKMLSAATNTVAPTYAGAIMLGPQTLFHATANFSVFDIGLSITGGVALAPGAFISGIIDSTKATVQVSAALVGNPFVLTILNREDGLIPTMLPLDYAPEHAVVMEIGPQGALLDAAAAAPTAEEPSNYLARKILSIATVNGGRLMLGGAVSTQVPKEPSAGTTEWDVLDELPVNLVPIGGRNIYKAWGDTDDTGGSGYILNGGTAVDPDGMVPNPPGLNADLILRKSAEHFMTYRGTYLEIAQEDFLNQNTATISYINQLVKGGIVLPPPPLITSATNLSGMSGTFLPYQLTATGAPFLFSMTPDTSPGYDIVAFNPDTGEATINLLNPGVYPITLKVTSTIGTATRTLALMVEPPISGNVPPIAGFFFSNNGLTTSFTDTSTDADGNIVGWNWIFGDGATSLVQNPSHTFPASRTYDVSLGATDNRGATNFRTISDTVNATVKVPPVAKFTEVATDLNVVFTDESTAVSGTILVRDWIFGDGGNSSGQNPTHNYLNPGTYVVTLMVNDSAGGTDISQQTLVLTNPGAPTAEFDFSVDDLSVEFFNLSADLEGGPLTSLWLFGDGDSSILSEPTHIYRKIGSYVVLLLVTDVTKKQGSITHTVDIALALGGTGDENVTPSVPVDASLRSNMKAVCKLRWVPKEPGDLMVIRNLDALRLMADAIISEQNGEWDKAAKAQMRAEQILEAELKEYLSGIQHTVPYTADNTFGMGDIGGVL